MRPWMTVNWSTRISSRPRLDTFSEEPATDNVLSTKLGLPAFPSTMWIMLVPPDPLEFISVSRFSRVVGSLIEYKKQILIGNADVVLACGFEKMAAGSLENMGAPTDDRAISVDKHIEVVLYTYKKQRKSRWCPKPMVCFLLQLRHRCSEMQERNTWKSMEPKGNTLPRLLTRITSTPSTIRKLFIFF